MVREIDETFLWSKFAEMDANISHLSWYAEPGLRRLIDQQGAGLEEIVASVDPKFPQPLASTSSLRRVTTSDGTSLIIKELIQSEEGPFYNGTSIAQALTLAGEQQIGIDLGNNNGELGEFYLGIYNIEEEGGEVLLSPFNVDRDCRVVSVMNEVDASRTMAIMMMNGELADEAVSENVANLIGRSLSIEMDLPESVRSDFSSREGIMSRITDNTPGSLSRGEMGAEFDHLRPLASEYVNRALNVISSDEELMEYLTGEPYARRGGDVKPENVILASDDRVGIVIDQLSLFMNPAYWNLDEVKNVPWGINSPTYEAAFMFPGLLAMGYEGALQAGVDELANHLPEFRGVEWGDKDSVPMRALMFWVSMKAIEYAGFSTFNINDKRLKDDERKLLEFTINNYGSVGLDIIRELDR